MENRAGTEVASALNPIGTGPLTATIWNTKPAGDVTVTERVCPALTVEPPAGDEIWRAGWFWGAAKMLTEANNAKTVLPKNLPNTLVIGVDFFSALMDWLHYGLRVWNAGPSKFNRTGTRLPRMQNLESQSKDITFGSVHAITPKPCYIPATFSMWHILHLIARPIEALLGVFCVLSALVPYPGEEGKIQSKFEDFWIRVDDYQKLALSRHVVFMQLVAKLETELLDRVFGYKAVRTTAHALCETGSPKRRTRETISSNFRSPSRFNNRKPRQFVFAAPCLIPRSNLAS
jgi:hypothetical protein